MSKKIRKNVWSLNSDEVSYGMHVSSSGKSGHFQRRLKTTSSRIFLTHEPTKIQVEGDIPPGNYSKREMQQKRNILKQLLFLELERKVAKKLKIKGR